MKHSLLYVRRRLVVMAVGRVVVGLAAAVPLADVLVNVALELPAERATVIGTAGRRRHNVLQRYGLGAGGSARPGGRRLTGNSAVVLRVAAAVVVVVVVVDHHQRTRVRPVMMVPAVQLPVPLPAVGVLPHPALDGHQERADRQHQAADVQEPRVPGGHDGRHDQQEAHRDAREVKHLRSADRFINDDNFSTRE